MIFVIITIIAILALNYLYRLFFKHKIIQKTVSLQVMRKLDFNETIKMLNENTEKFENLKLIKHLRFIPGTYNDKLLKKISCLINPIINKINELSRDIYIVMEYKEIILSLDKNNNIYIFIDFFVYNVKHFNQKKRLLINCVVNNLGYKYLNHIRLYNFGKIDNGILDKTVLETSKITNYKNMKISGYKKRNAWILPDTLTNIKPFPCNNIINIWNNKSIKMVKYKGKKCYGINSSNFQRNSMPYFNPTLNTLPRDNLGLLQLFDLALGIPSFPTSHSV